MDLNAIKYLVSVVEENSFTKAAEQLNVPRSTLSRKLTELEADLGIRLLNRSTRSLSLTEAGRMLYRQSRQMLSQLEQVQSELHTHIQEPQGVLKIAIPVTPSSLFLARWLAEFQQNYPKIRLHIKVSDEFVNLVEEHIDIAIRVGPLQDSSLIAKSLFSTPRWLCASPELIAKRGEPKLLQDLQNFPKLGFKKDVEWSLDSKHEKQSLRFEPHVSINDMLSLVSMLENGSGIGLLPYFVAQPALMEGRLKRVLPDWQGPRAEFYLLYPHRQWLPAKATVLIEFLQNKAKKERSRLWPHETTTEGI